MSNKTSYVPAVVLGTAIGDALGMPYEARGCSIHPDLKNFNGDFVPGTRLELPAGMWTDDTEMTIELASALLMRGYFDGPTVAKKYIAWYQEGSPGMGRSTRTALENLSAWSKHVDGDIDGIWDGQGTKFEDPEAVGSGTAMRASVLGVAYVDRPDRLRWACKNDSMITHNHREAYAASLAVASTVAEIVRQKRRVPEKSPYWKLVDEFVLDQLLPLEDTLVYKGLKRAIDRQQLGDDPFTFADSVAGRWGNAWQIVSTAYFCARHYTFEAGICNAVKLGGDTDTRAAIVGAMLGAADGLEGIPEKYVQGVCDSKMLIQLDGELAALSLTMS